MHRLSVSLVKGDSGVLLFKLINGGIGDRGAGAAVGGMGLKKLLLGKVVVSFFKGVNFAGGCKGLEGRIGVGLLARHTLERSLLWVKGDSSGEEQLIMDGGGTLSSSLMQESES